MVTDNQIEAISLQHKQSWERLFSMLRSAKPGKGNVCHELAQLPVDKREEYVNQVWGGTALEKVRPLLSQIASIEEQISRLENNNSQ